MFTSGACTESTIKRELKKARTSCLYHTVDLTSFSYIQGECATLFTWSTPTLPPGG